MNNIPLLMKREYWEHRGGFLWAPIWITGVILKQTHSFHLAFVLVAVMVVIGAIAYAFIIGRIEPIRWRS